MAKLAHLVMKRTIQVKAKQNIILSVIYDAMLPYGGMAVNGLKINAAWEFKACPWWFLEHMQIVNTYIAFITNASKLHHTIACMCVLYYIQFSSKVMSERV